MPPKRQIGQPRRRRDREDLSESNYIRISNKTKALLAEDHDFEEWDEEELRRGERKVNGKFVGRAPAIIPRGAYEELVRRTIDQCMEQMRENMPALIESLTEMALDPNIEAKDRIKIIGMFMDRVFGKPVERKAVALTNGPAKWEGVLDVAIVNDEDVE